MPGHQVDQRRAGAFVRYVHHFDIRHAGEQCAGKVC
jgi:hypothetical protein